MHPVSARRPALNRPPAGRRDKIQNLVTYHTKRRDAIENHHETAKSNLFSACNRTDARPQFGRFSVNLHRERSLQVPLPRNCCRGHSIPCTDIVLDERRSSERGRACSAKTKLARARSRTPATCAQHEDYEAVRNMFTRSRLPENYQTPIFGCGRLQPRPFLILFPCSCAVFP